MASLGLRPYEGSAVLEIDPTLVFPILEILLGGTGKVSTSIQREVTEIEQNLMDGLLRIVLHDLREAWKTVTTIDFTIQSVDTEPQFLQVMDPNEAVVVVGIEMRIGENAGLMKITMPALMIKMMRQKFDQQWSVRKTESTAEEQGRVLGLIQSSRVEIDLRLPVQNIQARDLLALQTGDVLAFDLPVQHALDVVLNGRRQFSGHVVNSGKKRAAIVDGPAAH